MKNILVGLAILAVIAVIGAAAYEQLAKPKVPSGPVLTATSGGAPASPAASSVAAATQVRPGDMVMGNPDAKVTIVEYASLTCPHCAAFHATSLPALKENYIDKGTVKLVFRDFPLDGLALRAAMLPHCAGPMRYFGLLGTLFARQTQWRDVQDPLLALAAIARQAGMSEEDFKACLADKAVEKTVLDSALEADKSLGVNATPTFFVNGTKYSGGLTTEQLKAIVDPLVGTN
jgi:protein-disulfide isomerase